MSQAGDPEDRDLRDRLRGLRVDPPGEGFEFSLHRKLVAAGRPETPGPWRRLREVFEHRVPLLWPAAGLAAAVAAFLVLGMVRGNPPSAPVAVASVTTAEVPSTKVAVIRLNFSADVAVEGADFQVRLPDGLNFWADGEALSQRSFEWTQSLEAGDNVIPIAVRGHRPGHYRVTASAQIGEEWIEHEVLLEVTEG